MPPDSSIKTCPDCSHQNDASNRRCERCDRNLAGVKSQTASQATSSPNELHDEVPDAVEEQPTAVLDPSLADTQLLDPAIIAKPEHPLISPSHIQVSENLPVPPSPKKKFASLEEQKRRKNGAIVIVTVIVLFAIIFGLFHWPAGKSHTTQISDVPHGLGEFKTSNGELLGVNDGSFAPFLLGPGEQFKQQAITQWKRGHRDQAIANWQAALHIIDTKKDIDTNNDAESSIYLENQLVSLSTLPYKTLVVGTDLVDSSKSSKSDLQGVYVAQHEFNAANHGFHLRVLIANSGTDPENVPAVAKQIVQITTQDKTVVGVVSWLTSSDNLLAMPILAAAHIPMISPTASSDKLTGISPFFFRIAPPNNRQGKASALFAEQTLHAQKVVVFVDIHEPYSVNLAQDFEKQFRQDNQVILKEEPFTSDKTTKIGGLMQDALALHPDLLYFTARDTEDQKNFEDALPTSGSFASIPALAGDSGYTIEKAGYGRWYFVSFAFPEELNDRLGNYVAQFPFYQEYSNDFNQDGVRHGGYYGYTRPDNEAMLSYDVTSVLTQAILLAMKQQNLDATSAGLQHVTPDLLTSTLPHVVLQGVSGQIAFDAGHDPIKKAFVFLGVTPDGHTYMKDWQGCFTQTLCRNAS